MLIVLLSLVKCEICEYNYSYRVQYNPEFYKCCSYMEIGTDKYGAHALCYKKCGSNCPEIKTSAPFGNFITAWFVFFCIRINLLLLIRIFYLPEIKPFKNYFWAIHLAIAEVIWFVFFCLLYGFTNISSNPSATAVGCIPLYILVVIAGAFLIFRTSDFIQKYIAPPREKVLITNYQYSHKEVMKLLLDSIQFNVQKKHHYNQITMPSHSLEVNKPYKLIVNLSIYNDIRNSETGHKPAPQFEEHKVERRIMNYSK